jgi:hypothetical protein
VIDAAPILSTAQAAALLRCEPSTIETKARTGELPGLLWGNGGWVFPAAAFYDRLNELAIENAKQRRLPPPAPVAVSTVSLVRKSRERREPPALPSIS